MADPAAPGEGDFNQITLVGTVGPDVQNRLARGGPMLTFSVTTTRRSLSGTEFKDHHRASVHGRRATALVPYVTPGRRVCVVGAMRYFSTGPEGQRRVESVVRVDFLRLMDKAPPIEWPPRAEWPEENEPLHERD